VPLLISGDELNGGRSGRLKFLLPWRLRGLKYHLKSNFALLIAMEDHFMSPNSGYLI
jgi:hypothetical protein